MIIGATPLGASAITNDGNGSYLVQGSEKPQLQISDFSNHERNLIGRWDGIAVETSCPAPKNVSPGRTR